MLVYQRVSVLNFWGVVLMGGCEVPSFLTEAAMVLHLGRRSKCGTTSAARTATGRGSVVSELFKRCLGRSGCFL